MITIRQKKDPKLDLYTFRKNCYKASKRVGVGEKWANAKNMKRLLSFSPIVL